MLTLDFTKFYTHTTKSGSYLRRGCLSETMSSPACVLEPTAPVPVDPYLFGLNTLLGQIDNLPFEDPALLRAARTLGAGAFRWPGGGLADSWSLVDGRYDDHAKFAWANIWAPRTAWAPRGTFGPRRFWDGVGSASAGAARTGPVWVLNVFSLSPAEQLQQVAFLRQTGVPVRRVEIGNGPWSLHDPEYQTRWPNASAYMASILPVCKRVRELFPAALISVAGRHADQRWNAGLAEYADHFDAVSLRVYSPIQCDLDLLGPGLNQYSAVAAWGEHANIQTRKQLQSVLDKPIWLSEIELGDHHGCARTPFAHLRKDGAIPGIFWAGHVLAAINSYDASTPLRALNYHLFSHQRACRAGARHDTACWGVNESLVHLPPRERSKTSPVHVNGAGQILAHVNAVALRAHPGQQMRRVRRPLNLSCGSLNFGCVGEKRRCTPSDNPGRGIYSGFPLGQGAGSARCLQAAVFDSTTKPNASFVVLNRCTHSIEATLGAAEMLRGRLPQASRRWRLVATTYLADDPGALVGLPDDLHEDPFVFPWRTGPLSPEVNATELHHDDLDRHTVVLQAVSLTIATFSPAGEAPFQVPVDLRPGGRWAWRRDLARGTASWAAPDQRAFGKRLPKERAWRDGARAQDAHLASDTMPAGQRRSALRMPKNTSALRWQHAAPRPAPVVPKERPARATRATCDAWFSAHGVRDLASCRLACCEDAAPIVTPSHWGAMSHSERMAAFCCDARAEAPPWPPTNASQPGERLNVVHMVAHDLRADLATPTLTSLDGTVQFRHAFAQAPICSPSRFSFFVGRRAAVTRYHGFNADEQQRVMPLPRGILPRPTDVTPIAKAFADGGYATYGAATSWAERRDAWLGCVSCWTHGYWEGPSSSCTTRETPKRASESECWSQWGNDRAVAGHVATWLEDYAASPSAATARGFYVLAGFYAGHSAWPDEAAAHHAYGVGGYKLRNADVLQSRPKGTGELTAARAYGEGMRTASKLQGLRRGYLVKQKLCAPPAPAPPPSSSPSPSPSPSPLTDPPSHADRRVPTRFRAPWQVGREPRQDRGGAAAHRAVGLHRAGLPRGPRPLAGRVRHTQQGQDARRRHARTALVAPAVAERQDRPRRGGRARRCLPHAVRAGLAHMRANRTRYHISLQRRRRRQRCAARPVARAAARRSLAHATAAWRGGGG